MPGRSIVHRYQDPVDLIWLRAAADLGLEVQRSADAYAAYDGKGTLTISVADEFDPDDSLAQMIFHEICHWLVSGIHAREQPDWGLSNTSRRDLVYEYACHRLQAALAAPFGLREFMAVTTTWRPYWDALPDNPLKDGDDPAIAIAQTGFQLAQNAPFHDGADSQSVGDRGHCGSNSQRGPPHFTLEHHSRPASTWFAQVPR
ncbi:MAG UNVERIFIED_CONTAM: hypothetical protein LVR18_40205 [Planctomycetaceae bacterium]|jgi:hypothetical protein